MNEIRLKIWEKRNEKGIKVEELAAKVGIGRSTMYNYENNLTSPPLDILGRIARCLNVKVMDLIETGDNRDIF